MPKEFYKKYKSLIFLSLIMATIVSLTILPYPLILRYFIDSVLPTKNFSEITKWSFFLIFVILVRVIGNFFQNYLASIIEQRVTKDIQLELFRKILKLPIEFYVKNNTGAIMSRILNDAPRSVGFFRSYYLIIYSSLILVIASIIAMLRMSVLLTLIALLIIPILFIITGILNTKMFLESKKLSTLNQDVSKELKESLESVETVKIDGIYDKVYSRFSSVLSKLLDLNLKINKYGSFAGALLTSIVSIGPILLLIVGINMVINGKVTLGSLIAITNLLLFIYEPIQQISLAQIQIQQPRAIWNQLKALLEEKEEELEGEDISKFDIQFENVVFSYDDKKNVLDGVNLTILEKDKVAIVGKTGVGKSTVLKFIPKLILPKEGDVVISQKSLETISANRLREKMAYVSRNSYIFDGTIRENLTLEKDVKEEELEEVLKTVCLDGELELDTLVGEHGKALSDGQKVRLVLGRALLKNPKVLLIDEALTTLDPSTEKKILENLKEKYPHITAVIISHRDTVFSYVNKICVIEEGKAKVFENVKEFLESKYYKKVFGER